MTTYKICPAATKRTLDSRGTQTPPNLNTRDSQWAVHSLSLGQLP